MPELPDVEGYRRYLAHHAQGRRVERVHADPTILRNTTPQGLGRALVGGVLGPPRRHGKWLSCPVDGPTLVLHFGMTGSLVWSGEEPERHPYDRMILEVEGGELRYRDMRKLGGVWVVPRGVDVESVTGPLGPDAQRIDREDLVELLARRRGGVKAALMDQRMLAGLGNLLVDEILWRARVHPRRAIGDLGRGDLERIADRTEEVLRLSIELGRVPPDETWLMGSRDGRDATCPRCGTTLERVKAGGRTSVFCPRCQPWS
ncbi:MAG TPA: DNA-formamidopyrimidine glycosylase family protein [Actinomycetota bacterium]